MRIPSFITLFVLLQSHFLSAQEDALLPFTLNGNINADSGVIQLNVSFDSDYYPKEVAKTIKARVENRKFTIKGFIPYPQGVTLSYGERYYSYFFVIEPGTQSVTCNLIAGRETPKVDNATMKEYEMEYLKAYAPVNQKRIQFNIKRDSLNHHYQNKVPKSIKLALEQELKGYYREGDRVLLEYINTHPDSYFAFWKVIGLFRFSYENTFDEMVDGFSGSLKNTHAGKVLQEKLAIAAQLDYGKKFPSLPAYDPQDKPLNYASFSNNQFTFIDFWYSGCHPCISQFPHLKSTYETYKEKGFEIIGISTDKVRHRDNWQNMIRKYQLAWPQYWDKEGVESAKFSIHKFPTNFLLDSEGNIVKKDLRPVELEQFLQENL
ncbi:TlpA disulfide reductase family protein [Rapidithrix thailandica]|uniref:TlpA disulfide reductase family protein n=1 Tax=Rapidithrix thailandica TaxID=413964 RepID=A0AAW9S440_9BACT